MQQGFSHVWLDFVFVLVLVNFLLLIFVFVKFPFSVRLTPVKAQGFSPLFYICYAQPFSTSHLILALDLPLLPQVHHMYCATSVIN